MLFLGCRPAPGRGLLRQHPCPPPQEPGKDRQELAVRTGDSDRTEEGESPTRVPGWVPSWWGLKRLVTSVGCWGLMGFGSLCGDPGTGLGDVKTLLVLGEGSGCSHAGTGGQREEEKQTKSLHERCLQRRYCLPADAETLEEPLLSFPGELSVLERLGLQR